MSKTSALSGVIVVSVEQAVAAPYATSRLADAGATVYKIERPEGDFARGYDQLAGGLSSYFVWINRGKQSVVIDLTTDEGRAALMDLVSGADVFVQNLRHGTLDRFGFSPEALRAQFPRLITCSITGFDASGPMARRKAYDLLIQAETGLASITGGPQEAARVGISVVDVATGATAHAAILEALFYRERTGEGASIEASLFDVTADWMTVPLLQAEGGKAPKRLGLAHPSIAPYGVFATVDGRQVLLSIQNDREWARLCVDLLGDAGLAQDPRLANNTARVTHRDVTDGLVAQAIATRGMDEIAELLDRADIAYAEVNDLDGLSQHPGLRRITVETENGAVSMPAPGVRTSYASGDYGPVPAVGQNDLNPS
ncbi:MAG: CaiB/BaiF CoA-transferase family protein [Pseudomonadota bacterium]|nr:CaiB/BaiF CoA-transferase family protein [Pseudomonadota bacterium]